MNKPLDKPLDKPPDKPLGSKTKSSIWTVKHQDVRSRLDYLATEEPLEIRLTQPAQTLAVTMRTPGHDFDLTTGFLFAEGIIAHREDLQTLRYCVDPELDGDQRYNIVSVAFREGLQPPIQRLERHFFTTSACGVCGKASLESLKIQGQTPLDVNLTVSPATIYQLPHALKTAQNVFAQTGGLHAAALFSPTGELLRVREDVGRHNALDKLIGACLMADELPLEQNIVMVSGRSSFEILQKCLMARVPIICAVSAPSSLAVAIAREFNITLIGFLRGETFNVYSGIERIRA
ncbi:MAG: formate dehydrogenase accessory sulfurtransferase FdhD [Elainellaceae cyanobacterium]